MICPRCGDIVPSGATWCECGQRLPLTAWDPQPAKAEAEAEADAGEPVFGCVCGGQGVCTPCVIESYERRRAA